MAQIAIIGAGPAGLMAAELLASRGCRVDVYDHMPNPARKLLIAGRGGLNLTHSEPLPDFLDRYGAARDWLDPAITAFPPEALRAWCEGLGQPTYVGSSGRVFPMAMKASQLLRAWLARLDSLGVQLHTRHQWLGWQGNALCLRNAEGEKVQCTPEATLLALGGASWPRLGSTGAWVPLLQEKGVAVHSLQPANCGFVVPWSDYFSSRFAGQPLKPVVLHCNGERRQGEAMITAQGIEGGVVYALGASIRAALEAHGEALVYVDTRPTMPHATLAARLAQPRGGKSLSNVLRAVGFSPLVVALLYETQGRDAVAAANAQQLATWLKALPLRITGTAGMARAISSAGGVARNACTEDWMLREVPGVFVAGEMLDWEAPTGGYLLQACFATGIGAAHGILRYVKSCQ